MRKSEPRQRLAGLPPATHRTLLPLLAVLILLPILAQKNDQSHTLDPLSQDSGAAGLKQMLVRLQTTARLLHTTAHPDDEDGGMLTLESRGRGATVTLLTLNRGEGGQNKIGSNLFDVLGVLRTLELTASDRYYGVEQRFTHVADFGYSKSPEETFQKWQGHDLALSNMVRVIRTFRPDVIASRFQGTDRDGHGHHEASGILSREAFHAAADPKRFPEQIREGLEPWQAKKLYVDGFGMGDNYTVKLNTGEDNGLLGMSYVQFAMEGLRHQLSQGAGGWSVEPGPRYSYYKLADSVLPESLDKDGHEPDFFEGIDTTLPGLAARLAPPGEERDALRAALVELSDRIRQAAAKSDTDASAAVERLFGLVAGLDVVVNRFEHGGRANADGLERLREKRQQATRALNLALGISLEATVVPPKGAQTPPPERNALTMVSPGESFQVMVTLHNRSKYSLSLNPIALQGFTGWTVNSDQKAAAIVPAGKNHSAIFHLSVPSNAAFTRPALHRNDPERDSVYAVDEPQYETLPFPPYSFHAQARYSILGRVPDVVGETRKPEASITAPVLAALVDSAGAQRKRKLAVVPLFSVELQPIQQVIRTDNGSSTTVKVAISCNRAGDRHGSLRLQVPQGWRAEPSTLRSEFRIRGEKREFAFTLIPATLKEGRAEIRAVLDAEGQQYSEGYTLVTREDLDAFYYYQPAVQRVSVVDAKIPAGLKIAYIPGAGDDIPVVLQQLGMDVSILSPEKIATENLSSYGTIVLGIRAYDTQKSIAAHNKELLDFVAHGGTLVVQYNASASDFNGGHFTPYPIQLSRARVSVEEAPVEVLAPNDGIFNYPNRISARDFDGWVQERGLYFASQWDEHFVPLLASHDPGEEPQKGGLLRAKYGKGTYIYTGYAFFRQLPAGVPGAIRLYVNVLSAGR